MPKVNSMDAEDKCRSVLIERKTSWELRNETYLLLLPAQNIQKGFLLSMPINLNWY